MGFFSLHGVVADSFDFDVAVNCVTHDGDDGDDGEDAARGDHHSRVTMAASAFRHHVVSAYYFYFQGKSLLNSKLSMSGPSRVYVLSAYSSKMD